MDKEIHHADVWFEGRVQGVGFRYQTLKIARGYDVSGTVRNLPDGRVLLHAEGAEGEVSAFTRAVAEEMRPFIRSVETRLSVAPPRERGFTIVS
ncbi:MAG: acylphosphatase [Candidatus Spyradosoma sp.]